ncbi:MAG: hypothetical protein KDA46_14390 [Parvularculaceae bacterium]|nr:hypothetical protein [Parvularculaceae bacterium]
MSANASHQAGKQVRLAPVIIAMLAAFAMLKIAGLWVSFSGAAAQDASEISTASMQAPAPVVPPISSPTSQKLFEQLAARQRQLDAREAALDTREKLLAAAEIKLDADFEKLRAERADISSREQDRAAALNQDYAALSSAYERMKARDAARIFNVLDEDILVRVAAGMRTQALAGVLAQMEPKRATMLTKALANEAPKPGVSAQ